MKYSYELSPKKPIRVLKQNDFKERLIEVKEWDLEKKEWNTRVETDFDFSRKTFQNNIDELIEKKFVVLVKSSDKRAKYYAITPLGILYAIKNDGIIKETMKINSKIQDSIFPILDYFAFKYVRPYRSEIFDKTMDFYKFSETLQKSQKGLISSDLPYTLLYSTDGLNYDNFSDTYEYKIKLLSDRLIEIPIAKFNLDNEITVSEFSRTPEFGNYKAIKLSDEQFHNYLAKLILSSITYFHFQIQIQDKIDYDKLELVLAQVLIAFNQTMRSYIASMVEGLTLPIMTSK